LGLLLYVVVMGAPAAVGCTDRAAVAAALLFELGPVGWLAALLLAAVVVVAPALQLLQHGQLTVLLPLLIFIMKLWRIVLLLLSCVQMSASQHTAAPLDSCHESCC
jgi:hypothetical protein